LPTALPIATSGTSPVSATILTASAFVLNTVAASVSVICHSGAQVNAISLGRDPSADGSSSSSTRSIDGRSSLSCFDPIES
jgi:hypothetical protein